jgi:hypothetical protein
MNKMHAKQKSFAKTKDIMSILPICITSRVSSSANIIPLGTNIITLLNASAIIRVLPRPSQATNKQQTVGSGKIHRNAEVEIKSTPNVRQERSIFHQ